MSRARCASSSTRGWRASSGASRRKAFTASPMSLSRPTRSMTSATPRASSSSTPCAFASPRPPANSVRSSGAKALMQRPFYGLLAASRNRPRLLLKGAACRPRRPLCVARRRPAMNVETILRNKGGAVATIAPQATIRDATALLRRERIGALVVSSGGNKVEGILSERDIVHGLADRGAALLDMAVEALMTRRVFTCTPRDSVGDLMAMMTERRIRHIPVLTDGMLVGIISIGDVVKHRLDEMEYETSSLRSFIAGDRKSTRLNSSHPSISYA